LAFLQGVSLRATASLAKEKLPAMAESALVRQKIEEICEEMQNTGLWTAKTPDWVRQYERYAKNDPRDFSNWLQFVYLPARLQQSIQPHGTAEREYIAPRAAKFLNSDRRTNRLLQLLIELDSL